MEDNIIYEYNVNGANDTITSGRDLKLIYEFVDGDERTTTLPNPRNNLTQSDLDTATNALVTEQAFIGDKNGSAFNQIKSAEITEWTKTKFDLS